MVPRFFFFFQRLVGLLRLRRRCRNCRRKGKIENEITHEIIHEFYRKEAKRQPRLMGSALFHFLHNFGAMSFTVSIPPIPPV